MANVGEYIDKFSRTYLHLNPDPFTGPGTWRLSNIPSTDGPDASGGLKDIYTLLPIGKTEAGTTTNLFFNIEGLPTINSVTTRKNYIASVLGTFTSSIANLPKNSTFSLQGLNGISPIETMIVEDAGIVYFNMDGLPTLDTVKRHRLYNISPSTFKYNSRSVDVLTADEPLQSITAMQTATVSIDFRNLPEA